MSMSVIFLAYFCPLHVYYWKIDCRYARKVSQLLISTCKIIIFTCKLPNLFFFFFFLKNQTLICEHLLPSVSIRQRYYVDMLLQLIYVSMQVNNVLTCNLNINMWDNYIHINIMFSIIEADIQLGCQDPKIFLEGRVLRVFMSGGGGGPIPIYSNYLNI